MFFQESKTLAFKKIIIIFWTLWWGIALWTDIVGLLTHNGLLQQSWAPNTNYPFLIESLKMYHVPTWFPPVCITGIILWSFLTFAAFFRACTSLTQPTQQLLKKTDSAFIIALGLWFAFFLADQLVMKFDLEENHMVQGGFQLLTYLALYILPSD